MELQTIKTEQTAIVKVQDIPQEALVGKHPLSDYLPEDLKTQLPATVIAKISQSKLKHSNQKERETFAQSALAFINPNLESEAELNIVLAILMDFSADCELTANEFMMALKLSADGKLFLEGVDGKSIPVKLLRKIDQIALRETQQAYIHYRNKDKLHQQGQDKLKAYLNPPKEKSEEELKAERIEFLKGQYKELQSKGSVRASVIFYPLLRKKHKEVKLDFLDNFLNNFKPETIELKNGAGIDFSNPAKVVKNNVHTSFKDAFVSVAIQHYKLKEKTEEQWIEFWEELKELKE